MNLVFFLFHLIARVRALVFAAAAFGLGWGAMSAQTLRFASQFEAGTEFVTGPGYHQNDLAGRDRSMTVNVPADWVADLDDSDRLGNFSLRYDCPEGGARAALIDDPTGGGRGRVLEFWLRDPSRPLKKGRVQTNIYGGEADLNEITSAVKMYLHPDLAVLSNWSEALTWFTLQELWTNPDWNLIGKNFRISLSLGKRAGEGQKLHWGLHSDEAGKNGETFFELESDERGLWASDVLSEWITVVMHYKKGDAMTGRIRVKIVHADGTEQELFDQTAWTMHPSYAPEKTGLTHHNPMKLYTGEKTVDFIRTHAPSRAAIIYWDDWEYWEGDAYSDFAQKSAFRAGSPAATAAAIHTGSIAAGQ
jgi:hypothetical protein